MTMHDVKTAHAEELLKLATHMLTLATGGDIEHDGANTTYTFGGGSIVVNRETGEITITPDEE